MEKLLEDFELTEEELESISSGTQMVTISYLSLEKDNAIPLEIDIPLVSLDRWERENPGIAPYATFNYYTL